MKSWVIATRELPLSVSRQRFFAKGFGIIQVLFGNLRYRHPLSEPRVKIANLASSLKVNLKMQGTNHAIQSSIDMKQTLLSWARMSRTLGKVRFPSMAGVVATVDNEYTQYFASACLQPNNTEASFQF